MTIYRNPAIIIGGGSANGLGIARNLGSRGIDVYCLTSNPYEYMRTSKYCKGFSLIPEVEKDEDKLKTVLHQFEPHLKEKAVLFPTTDTSLLTLSSILKELNFYVTYIPNRKNIETCVFKHIFYKSLETHEVPHPTTYYLDEEKLEDIMPQLSFPLYIRPSQSQVFDRAFGKKGFEAENSQELKRYIQIARMHNIDVMVQQVIPGPTSNGYALRGYIDKKSRLVALMADQKIRQPSMFSSNSIKRSIPVSQVSQAKETLIEYLHAIKYQGLFHAEFKKDPRDNIYKLLEINARSSGGNYFGVACGMNHVLLAYLDSIGEEVQSVNNYETDVYIIHILRDIPILINKLVNGQVSNQDIYMYFRKKYWHILSKDDIPPFITASQEIIKNKGIQKLMGKLREKYTG